MKKNVTPKSRQDELVVQELDGEILIYDLRNDKAFCLNATSAIVWQACDGQKSVAEINRFVSEKLNAQSNEDLVWLALDQLKKEKLIENGAEMNNHFEGLSRREVIRKVGLASAVVLPVVASLVAPLAVQAVSGCMTGTPCSCPGGTPNPGTCPQPTCNSTPAFMCTCSANPPGPANRTCL